MRVSRWFVRCPVCLAISAIDEPPTADMVCGLCTHTLDSMGRVELDRLVHDHLVSACDDRCTSARGPLCSCKCRGQNHGSHRVVRVTRDAGPVPTITPKTGREQCRINAAEYLAHRAALLARLDPLREKRRAGYLPFSEYAELQRLSKTLAKTIASRDHRARMRAFRAVLGYIPTPEPTPIETVAEQVAEAIATAAPLADAPFTLTRSTQEQPTKQASLFT